MISPNTNCLELKHLLFKHRRNSCLVRKLSRRNNKLSKSYKIRLTLSQTKETEYNRNQSKSTKN